MGCLPSLLANNPTSEQESAAIAAAEEECTGEADTKQKSLHEQLGQYQQEHGIAQDTDKSKTRAAMSVPNDPWDKYKVKRLSAKDCAAEVRTFYPGAYDDLSDTTLTKKVLAKYPSYCDITPSPPDFIPDIKGIR